MTSTTIDHIPANKGRKLPPEPLTRPGSEGSPSRLFQEGRHGRQEPR